MGQVENGARALVEQVGIEAVGAQQRDPVRQPGFLGAAHGKRRLGLLDLLAELEPGDDAPIALNGVVAEIRHDARHDERPGQRPRPPAKFTQQRHALSESQARSAGQEEPLRNGSGLRIVVADSLVHVVEHL